jgi:putative membrane protein insertion efficiency factor
MDLKKTKLLLICCFLLYSIASLKAQNKEEDVLRIKEKNFDQEEITYYQNKEKNNTAPIKAHSHNFIIANNPFNLFFKGLMLVYQKAFSPQISAECIYETTCSNFSKKAISEFGLIKGIFLTADRLLRCNQATRANASPFSIIPNSGKIIDEPAKYRLKQP